MTVGEAFFAYPERRRWPVLALVLGFSAVCVYLEGKRKVSASIWEIFDKEHPVITAGRAVMRVFGDDVHRRAAGRPR